MSSDINLPDLEGIAKMSNKGVIRNKTMPMLHRAFKEAEETD